MHILMNASIYFFLQWLKKDFLRYLSEWEEYADKNTTSAKDNGKMMLSRETLEGIRMTGNLLFQ